MLKFILFIFRHLRLAMDGKFSDDSSFSLLSLNSVNSKEKTVTLTVSLFLQKWQSIGVYLSCKDQNEPVEIMEGGQFSVILLGAYMGF